ncbi:zeta toxin [Candidatus Brocadia pituitae]|nr:zeta toxin [Candidatus Brocadia pituitae]
MYSTICHGIQPEVSDTDIYNKLLYCINADPYSLTLGDIVSTEGISVSDKTKALEALQRNQELTGRPNYKAARELFDIDFKQKFGEDLSIDPAGEKAKWLRVFHGYIIDKKMEPLDAAEKIRKDYELQNNPPPAPSQEGNITNTPSQEFDETNPLKGGVGKSTTKHHQDARNPKFNPQSETQNLKSDIDPTDSLFAGIGKSVIQGTTSFPRTFWGVGAMMEDIAKNIPQAIPLAAFTQIVPEDFFKRRYEDVKGIEERFQAKGEGYKKYINGAIRTMSEMASQFVGTAGMGTLTGMSTGAGVDKYLGSRKEGYSIPRSFAAGGVTAGVEYVTEKAPLEIIGRPGLKFVDRLMKGLVSDVYGEVNATLAEMSAVDYAILGKSHTPGEYLSALRDTIFTAAATTLGATSVTHPFTRGETQQMPGGQETPKPGQTQQAQPSVGIWKVTKAEFGGDESAYKNAITQAIASDKPVPAEIASQYPETKQIFEKKYRESNVPVSDELFAKVGVDKGKIFADYIKLQQKHPEQFNTPLDVKSHTEYVLEAPQYILPVSKEEYTLLVRRNGKDRAAVVEFILKGGKYRVRSAYELTEGQLDIKLKKAQDGGRNPIPVEKSLLERGITQGAGVPSDTLHPESSSGTPVASDASSQTSAEKIPEKPPSQTSETFPGNPTSNIQQGQEFVNPIPDIQLMPSLKGLVGTGKLSIEDALEIDDVARQNNWSDDTVKQFHKSAIEGLGIQNAETQGLASLLVTARIKEAVYKQNAEKYKQELAEAESQIERISKLLKIEGGAPDKYEGIARDFLKNLGDMKDLKPEEIIQKAQEEFALNLGRLDTGMDVKTLITAAVQTINEAEGISKETISHEQTVNEALKELPGIYSKVMGMKRGKTLTRPQQLAARMLGTALFETFNKTKLLGMANPTDQKLYQQAQANLVELGQYWSKVLASSSEIGRMLEAQKIIEKVGADIPATEEFQKVLEMLTGQKEITPEQFYQLTGMLKTPDQLAEMTRELAKPVTRRIQDIFLEAWINGLLSNPQTHATNVLSNLYTTFASIPERYLASKTRYGDKPGVVDGEAKAMLYGMQMGFWDAVKAARLVWATETGRFGRDAQKVENAKQKAISAENINRILGRLGVNPMNQTLSNAVDYVGKIWRLPTRSLTTADEFFKMINYRMELQALAYRQAAMEGLVGDKAGVRIAELIGKPTVEMRARAISHANIQTFTGEMSALGKAISGFTERVPMAKIIVPFVRTPENIFTYTWERTPFLAYANKQCGRLG